METIIEKRIDKLAEEQQGEYEELDGDNGGITTTTRYWEIEEELKKLYSELDNYNELNKKTMKFSITVYGEDDTEETYSSTEVELDEDSLSDVNLLSDILEELLKPHFNKPKF